jgi:hypothetical protein
MQAARSILHAGDFMRLKEHLFGMPQINALFISSSMDPEMIEQGIDSIIPWHFLSLSFDFSGIQLILDITVDLAEVADRSLLSPFSSHWAQLASSAPRFSFTTHAQVWANFYVIPPLHELTFL